MILHLYIARRFLVTFVSVLFILGAMTYLIGLVENVNRFGGGDASFASIMRLTLLLVPYAVYRLLPLIAVISTISLFIALSRSSELVVSRASGRSAMRSLGAPVAAAILIGVIAVAILNPIVAATSREQESSLNRITRGSDSVLSVSEEGMWLRQGDSAGQTVIRASHADLDGTRLSGTTFIGLGPNGKPTIRIEAATAELRPGAWHLTDAKIWDLDGPTNPEKSAETHDTYRLKSDLTRDQIRDSFGTPSAISFWDLPGFIKRLDAAGFSARSHRVWFQSQLALPLSLIAMVMIGAVFTLRHTRAGRTGIMILLATLCGFALNFIRNFAVILAENGQISTTIAVWGPPTAAILLSAGLLLHLEDG